MTVIVTISLNKDYVGALKEKGIDVTDDKEVKKLIYSLLDKELVKK